ncbi:MAG: helix-turn-helix domain-containing protein [Endomicrobiales bacterium]|nr:helix-turn-helix domain-containing protein [Endomicrobiales bacterium]
MEQKLLNINQLCEYLSVKKNTLRDWVYRGRIPYIKVGNLVRFNKEHIEIWLESREHIPFDMKKCYNAKSAEGEEHKI